jgi:hypothetical protein
MQPPIKGTIIAFVTEAQTIRDLGRIVVPGYDILQAKSAPAALAAAGALKSLPAAIVAELRIPASKSPASADPKERESLAVVLLEAARIRYPDIRRVLLAPADLLPALVRLLHSQTAESLVPLPLEADELVAAVAAPTRASGGMRPSREQGESQLRA